MTGAVGSATRRKLNFWLVKLLSALYPQVEFEKRILEALFPAIPR